MAKLTAPLMSFGARGKLGGSLVYSAWKGVNTARQLVTPANPNTPSQKVQRGLMATVVQAWRSAGVSQAIRLGWDKLAQLTGLPLSGFNAFTSQLVRLAAEIPAASFVAQIGSTLADELGLVMRNLDDLTAGTETGNFLVLVGESPDALLQDVNAVIDNGQLVIDVSQFGFEPGDVVFLQVRKAGTKTTVYDRSGIMGITLSAE